MVRHLSEIVPEDYPYYFFDTNVWIYYLKSTAISPTVHWQRPYLDFVDAVFQAASMEDPKLTKRMKNVPKVIVTSLLQAELINAYLGQVVLKQAQDRYANDELTLKRYRNTHPTEYKSKLDDFLENFLAFEEYFYYLDDSFRDLGPNSLLRSLDRNADYNDLYYAKHLILWGKSVCVITNDQDFSFPNLNVATTNNILLRR